MLPFINSPSGHSHLKGSFKKPKIDHVHIGKTDLNEQVRCLIHIRRKVGHLPLKKFHELKEPLTSRMSRDEFIEKHGASQEDIDKIVNHVTSAGPILVSAHAARRQIVFTGTVGQFNKLFSIECHTYEKTHPYKKRRVQYRLHREVSLPTDLIPIVVSVLGINNELNIRPFFKSIKSDTTTPTVGAWGCPYDTSVFTCPPQLGSLYNHPTTNYTLGTVTAANGFVATGQTIGLIALPGDGYALTDIYNTFTSSNLFSAPPPGSSDFGQTNLGYPYLSTGNSTVDGPDVPALSITNVSVDGTTNPGTADGGEETLLDICMSYWFSTTPDIAVYFFNENTDIGEVYGRMIHPDAGDPVCDILSFSFGQIENASSFSSFQTYDTLFEDASLLGITVLASSGDQGVSDFVRIGSGYTTSAVSSGATSITFQGDQSSETLATVSNYDYLYVTGPGIPQFAYVSSASKNSSTGYITITLSSAVTQNIAIYSPLAFSTNLYDLFVHVSYPASSPWVTGVGGTVVGNVTVGNASTFVNSSNYFTEWVWTDPSGGTGGGISQLYSVPSYQSSVALPINIDTGLTGRGVPDISANASPFSGVVLSFGGSFTAIGGTSMSTPMYAGLIANLNTKLGKNIGFLNTTLYSLYKNNSPVLRDIVPGNDYNGSVAASSNSYLTAGYSTGTGWDACTGLGVLDGSRFLSYLQGLTVPAYSAPNPPNTIIPVNNQITGLALSSTSATYQLPYPAFIPVGPGYAVTTTGAAYNPTTTYGGNIINYGIPCPVSFALIPIPGVGNDGGALEVGNIYASNIYQLNYQITWNGAYGCPYIGSVGITIYQLNGSTTGLNQVSFITGIDLTSYVSIQGMGNVVAAILVPTIGFPFSGTFQLSGPDTAYFNINNSTGLLVNAIANIPVSTASITITAVPSNGQASFYSSFTISIIAPIQSYYIQIQATNSVGTSPLSTVYGPVTVAN